MAGADPSERDISRQWRDRDSTCNRDPDGDRYTNLG